MKIKMLEAVTFNKFCGEELLTKKLPIKTAFKITTILNEIAPSIQFYEKQLKKIIEENTKKDEEGNYVQNEKGYEIDNVDKFNAEISELSDLEIDISIDQLTLDEIDVNIDISTLLNIQSFIKKES